MGMKSEIRDRLVTGISQYLSAEAAGSARFAVADGYLAIDNFFSALLLHDGVVPSRNHKQKLEAVVKNHSDLLSRALATQSDLEAFYDAWQGVRYSAAVPTPNETIRFLRLAYRVISEIMEEFAADIGLSKDELEEDLYSQVVGTRWAGFEEQVSQFHDARQQHLEMMGEMGHGSKLGNKMLDSANYCDVRALTDDALTRGIVAADEHFASAVAEMYSNFVNLIDYVQAIRYGHVADPGESPNFTLSIRLSYAGQSVQEAIEDFRRMVRDIDRRREAGESGGGYRT